MDLSHEKALLYQAFENPIGIVIRTNNPAGAIHRFQRAKAELYDSALNQLAIRRSPSEPESTIYIVRKTRGHTTTGNPK